MPLPPNSRIASSFLPPYPLRPPDQAQAVLRFLPRPFTSRARRGQSHAGHAEAELEAPRSAPPGRSGSRDTALGGPGRQGPLGVTREESPGRRQVAVRSPRRTARRRARGPARPEQPRAAPRGAARALSPNAQLATMQPISGLRPPRPRRLAGAGRRSGGGVLFCSLRPRRAPAPGQSGCAPTPALCAPPRPPTCKHTRTRTNRLRRGPRGV
jgi:hypothetical protein